MDSTATSAAALLQRRLNLNEVQISVLSALEHQLPKVNELLESSFADLSETFVGMSSDINEFQSQMNTLAALNPDDDVIGEMACTALEVSTRLSENLTKVIMGLQFQDRVSQNLVIAISVVRELALELNQYSTDVSGLIGDKEIHPDGDSITTFLNILKLGEVKQLFLDFLRERGHEAIANEVGGGFHGHRSNEEDIELF